MKAWRAAVSATAVQSADLGPHALAQSGWRGAVNPFVHAALVQTSNKLLDDCVRLVPRPSTACSKRSPRCGVGRHEFSEPHCRERAQGWKARWEVLARGGQLQNAAQIKGGQRAALSLVADFPIPWRGVRLAGAIGGSDDRAVGRDVQHQDGPHLRPRRVHRFAQWKVAPHHIKWLGRLHLFRKSLPAPRAINSGANGMGPLLRIWRAHCSGVGGSALRSSWYAFRAANTAVRAVRLPVAALTRAMMSSGSSMVSVVMSIAGSGRQRAVVGVLRSNGAQSQCPDFKCSRYSA